MLQCNYGQGVGRGMIPFFGKMVGVDMFLPELRDKFVALYEASVAPRPAVARPAEASPVAALAPSSAVAHPSAVGKDKEEAYGELFVFHFRYKFLPHCLKSGSSEKQGENLSELSFIYSIYLCSDSEVESSESEKGELFLPSFFSRDTQNVQSRSTRNTAASPPR